MKLHNLKGRKKMGYTTWGCMWEKGHCTTETSYALFNDENEQVPVQSRVTAWWPDGSVKWSAHTADTKNLSDTIEVKSLKEYGVSNSSGIEKTEFGMRVALGCLKFDIPASSHFFFQNLYVKDRLVLTDATSRLIIEEPSVLDGNPIKMQKEYAAKINRIEVEEEGPLFLAIRYEGIHVDKNGEKKIPFIIRMKVGLDCEKIDFVHTFLYDGNEEKDYLKGLCVRFHAPLTGQIYNRHVKFEGDYGCFHEAMAQLLSWHPRIAEHVYRSQMNGVKLDLAGKDLAKVDQILGDMPYWSEYDMCQDSPSHFSIKKKMIDKNCCYLDCLSGLKTRGAAAFGSENGSILFSIRDFREKYPSGYTFKNLDQEEAWADIWLWPSGVDAMDFRHYANRGYNQVYYEGYDYKGATPFGIACTSEFSVAFSDALVPTDEELMFFSKAVNSPAQYVCEPELYHEMRAFGYWSLPTHKTPMEQWLEGQLDLAVDFYKQEVKQRNWYGMFHYGDFMHTYDKERHQWRYDMGGYAWDNTELVPTLWLWLMFMRTGREDIFTLAEKLSRHASEVDVYHIGKLKGLGSRHNVRHWGCPCKEARIAMAAHHRFYYYMTGDHRMGEIFEEWKDNEMTFLAKNPLEAFYDREQMVYPSHARSGPDWSSLCANWMTQWERFNDGKYKEKIVTGIEDIKRAPLKLVSGPDFEFDPETVHLRYIGEKAAGGTHLQICMGAPQVWLELADLLEDEEWKRILAEYGRFYYLDKERQLKESGGIIGNREFTFPFMAAAMGAYGAKYLPNEELAKTTWRHLLGVMIQEGNFDGFKASVVRDKGNQNELSEIPWISTNFVAQWCLNTIMALDFIRDMLPVTLYEAEELLRDTSGEGFRKA